MATDALKRIAYADHKAFQKRVGYYFWDQAKIVLAQDTPDPDDLKFAKAIYANQVSMKDMCLTVITNSSIGGTLDNDGEPTEDSIEWTVKTDNQFHNLALAYSTAGLI